MGYEESSRTFIVTRHQGAVDWLKQQGIIVQQHVTHLNLAILKPNDTVIGSLPVQMVAQLTAKNVRYIHLSLTVPEHLRGTELSIEQMQECNVKLEEISAVSHGSCLD